MPRSTVRSQVTDDDHAEADGHEDEGDRDRSVSDLRRARPTRGRPGGEVLAVPEEQVVLVFGQAGERPADHDLRCVLIRVMDHPDSAASGEPRERRDRDRPRTQPIGQAGVVHDPAVAQVDAVVGVAQPRRLEVVSSRHVV